MTSYSKFFNQSLKGSDKEVYSLIDAEVFRQNSKIILIPSESICPHPVRQALISPFTNIYAEGYPQRSLDREDEYLIENLERILVSFWRYSDRRFYRGCEYVNLIETLARKRAASLFATEKNPPENIYVNVQPLSGSAANIAVYDALLEPGEVIMGMSLIHGGHLTHGSEFNRSGKTYRVVAYEVDEKTEKLDYNKIYELAEHYRPKIIVAGYTSYPWAPDWKKFREIADSTGALLFADISHPAGLVVAGVYPNPVDYADVITFTTHKTIFGPRGAVIMTTNPEYAEMIEQAVFPGEQGGPHVNKFAAMAVAFKIAMSNEFKETQKKIVENAKVLSNAIQERGIRLAYGGTDTHLFVLDLKSINTDTGFQLKGEIGVRILDLCGIVANKNTIPGDIVTPEATGIRMGTPWITQRGITEEQIYELADIISMVLKNIKPFMYVGITGNLPRGKIDIGILEEGITRVGRLSSSLGIESKAEKTYSYPHNSENVRGIFENESLEDSIINGSHLNSRNFNTHAPFSIIHVTGERAAQFLEGSSTNKVSVYPEKHPVFSLFLNRDSKLISKAIVIKLERLKNQHNFLVLIDSKKKEKVLRWLRGLSDGYILFDNEDIFIKIEGPVIIHTYEELDENNKRDVDKLIDDLEPDIEKINFDEDPDIDDWKSIKDYVDITKPYFIGYTGLVKRFFVNSKIEQKLSVSNGGSDKKLEATSMLISRSKIIPELRSVMEGKKKFDFQELEQKQFQQEKLKRSALYEEHKKLSAVMTEFAGYKMPLRYGSIIEEHNTVRTSVGIFDLSHMGLIEVKGEFATIFLDAITTNYVAWINPGESQYSYLLDTEGNVVDDIMVYCVNRDDYLIVVNAANEDKDFWWIDGINKGEYIIDERYSFKEVVGKVKIVNLKSTEAGKNAKINLAIQGQKSIDVLKILSGDEIEKSRLSRLNKNQFMSMVLGGIKVIVSRTGYTGEKYGYEIFVHPEMAPKLWNLMLEAGRTFNIKPIGLGARDSLRVEAGLPLYGHELAGPYEISPEEAGFAPYIKFHKPFFIGRDALLKKTGKSKMSVARFKMVTKGTKMAKPGDIIIDKRTHRTIGWVTSCSVNGKGIQIGMGYIDKRSTLPGTEVAILEANITKMNIESVEGKRIPLPVDAKILSRFPENFVFEE